MSLFLTTLTSREIAQQIAGLLNANNKLIVYHTSDTILNSNTTYFVEFDHIGREQVVIGCIGVDIVSSGIEKIKHMSVSKDFRRRGVARKLLNLVLSNSNAEKILMNIRRDNSPSLNLALSCGFIINNAGWYNNQQVLTVERRKVLK